MSEGVLIAISSALITAFIAPLFLKLILKIADQVLNREARRFSEAKLIRDELWAELKTLRGRVGELDQQNDELVRENARLEGQLAQQDAELTLLRDMLNNVKLDRDAIANQLEQLRIARQVDKEALADLRSQISQMSQRISLLETENEHLRDENKRLKGTD